MTISRSLSMTLSVLLCGAVLRGAQSPALAAQAFEVVSLKPSNPTPTPPLYGAPVMAPGAAGRFTAQNTPLRLMVRFAYGVQDFQIFGGPSWQLTDKFDINAKAADPNANMADMRQMVKTMLADRFHLRFHMEPREVPSYTLVNAAADGAINPNIKTSTTDCSAAATEQARNAQALTRGGADAQTAIATMVTTPCGMTPWVIEPLFVRSALECGCAAARGLGEWSRTPHR
jgi:uncharacterized protein (TIGR03435 family)